MTKQDLKTGMTCQTKKNGRYMIYVDPAGEIFLMPISNIFSRDIDGAVFKKGLNVNSDLVLSTKMNEDMIEYNDHSSMFKSFYSGYSPYQIVKIWYAQSPLDIFEFLDKDLIWQL